MIFTPDRIRQRRREIALDVESGAITEAEAGARLIEADPDFGAGHLLLGNSKAQAGDFSAAEPYYWKALQSMPCSYVPYFSLNDVVRRKHADDPLAAYMFLLGTWKLSFYEKVPAEVVTMFNVVPGPADLDIEDPFTFHIIATAQERVFQPSSELRGRLLPYQLLNDLQRHAAEGLEDGLLEELLSQSERLLPVWLAALKEWAELPSTLQPEAFGMILALIGETAGPEYLDGLLELIDHDDLTAYLHANWAVWRMGQRLPEQIFAKLRAAAATKDVSLRCALAEQIDALPDIPGIAAAFTALLEGFPSFARDESAAYLLSFVTEALRNRNQIGMADRLLRQCRGHLSKLDRALLDIEPSETVRSRLIEEEIPGRTIQEICQQLILMPGEEDEDFDGIDDDEDFEDFQDATQVSLPKPGRNEPCWCGSGKKYKKCHLQADEQSERHGAVAPNQPAGESLHRKLHGELLDSIKLWRSGQDFQDAFLRYFGILLDENHSIEESRLAGFLEWVVYDFRPTENSRTIIEEFLHRRAARISPAERELLQAMREARFGIWEVQHVEIGKGLELRNLITEEQCFVDDVSCSRSLVQWDCMLCRLYRSEGRWYIAGTGISVPRNLVPKLTAWIGAESRKANISPAAFVKANSHRLHRHIDELAQHQWDSLKMVNAEGDELEFSTAQYRILDETSLLAALLAEPAFVAENGDPDSAHSFAWLEQGSGEQRRSYGHLRIRNGKLRLECNSRRRLETGRRLIETIAGAWIEHRGDSFQSQESIKRQALEKKPGRRPKEPELPPELDREIIAEFKRKHYADWVDQPLPALDGLSPRQAARSKSKRRQLEDLLRGMENREAHERAEGHAAFDFSTIRKQLGM